MATIQRMKFHNGWCATVRGVHYQLWAHARHTGTPAAATTVGRGEDGTFAAAATLDEAMVAAGFPQRLRGEFMAAATYGVTEEEGL